MRSAARRLAFAFLVVGAGMVALAAPAFAAASPPGWTDPGNGAWVGFSVSDTSPPLQGRTAAAPVTLTRETSTGLDVVTAFNNWEERIINNVSELGWPTEWSAGGVTLRRADDWCPAANSTCRYTFVSGSGQRFFFAAASNNADGSPNTVDLSPYDQGALSLPAPAVMTITFGWSPATNASPAVGTSPGRLTLDARASDGLPGELVFDWTVERQKDGAKYTAQGSAVSFDLDQDDVYCVSVKVTNTADGHQQEYGAPDCQYVDKVAPQAPAGNGGGGSGVGGIPTSGNAGAPAVVFAPPRRARSALTGQGPGADSSVVWLWRPEWYQPTTETRTLPQTTGSPLLKDRRDIVVSSTRAPSADAGPWLAGLGAFGLIGIGWVLNKRRKVRAEY